MADSRATRETDGADLTSVIVFRNCVTGFLFIRTLFVRTNLPQFCSRGNVLGIPDYIWSRSQCSINWKFALRACIRISPIGSEQGTFIPTLTIKADTPIMEIFWATGSAARGVDFSFGAATGFQRAIHLNSVTAIKA